MFMSQIMLSYFAAFKLSGLFSFFSFFLFYSGPSRFVCHSAVFAPLGGGSSPWGLQGLSRGQSHCPGTVPWTPCPWGRGCSCPQLLPDVPARYSSCSQHGIPAVPAQHSPCPSTAQAAVRDPAPVSLLWVTAPPSALPWGSLPSPDHSELQRTNVCWGLVNIIWVLWSSKGFCCHFKLFCFVSLDEVFWFFCDHVVRFPMDSLCPYPLSFPMEMNFFFMDILVFIFVLFITSYVQLQWFIIVMAAENQLSLDPKCSHDIFYFLHTNLN